MAFYDKPLLKFERLLETYLAFAPVGLRSFITAMPLWIKQKLWMRNNIRKELDFAGKVIFPEHHESHAASAFFPSPFEEAAILTIDGVGEWATTSFGIGRDNEVTILAEMHFPHSLGLLYSAFTYYTGFKVNSGEYKLMGLAPYGEPKYGDLILTESDRPQGRRLVPAQHGVLRLLHGLHHDQRPVRQALRRAAAKARIPADAAGHGPGPVDPGGHRGDHAPHGPHVHRETGMKNLCLAGGVALNCVGNGRILREGPFENIWIQPAAGDAGGALGAALFTWHQVLGNRREAAERTDRDAGLPARARLRTATACWSSSTASGHCLHRADRRRNCPRTSPS